MASDGRGLKFGTVAELYDRYRPTPPPEAKELFGDLRGRDVLEVGAGTGLWTRFLLGLGAHMTVVEPDSAMRAVLERQSPAVRSIEGRAEQLPLPDAAFDAVVVSSAWHWFEQPAATEEMARVLRNRGRLYVLWNGFSRDVPWVKELTKLRENPGDRNARPRGWTADLGDGGLFVDVVQVEIDWTWTRTSEQLQAVFGTYSGALVKTEAQRGAMDLELRRRIEQVAQAGMVQVPMTLRGTLGTRSDRRH
ncbi:MAG: methyltransferase domain-containing protein [Acidimicrobiales bacterium]